MEFLLLSRFYWLSIALARSFLTPRLLGTTLDEIYKFFSGKVDGTDSFLRL